MKLFYKKILPVLVLSMPLFLNASVGGSGWTMIDEDGDAKIIIFNKNGKFAYLNVRSSSGNQGAVFGDEETWLIEYNKLIISFSNGYKLCSVDYYSLRKNLSGTCINKVGLVEQFQLQKINI
tara:strand:+ start:105 stop:470 length:366 start_codon:yes stop_codon:yes gene_type:complete